MQKIIIKNKSEMSDFAKKIASSILPNSVIALKGTLGVGKSFFVKEFINEIQNKKTEILSPTFNLVYSYNTKKGEVFHFDLYRLKSGQELENIDFFDAIKNGICLIEWPEIAEKFLKKLPKEKYLEIEIATNKNEDDEERIVYLTTYSISPNT